MRIQSAEHVASAVYPGQYPRKPLPEVALVGRSNVGKSSLLNVLMNRKGLARTSSEPGKTRLVNFYEVNGRLRLVDLPGYGYAKVPESVRRSWMGMIEKYVAREGFLRAVLHILDARHAPSANDLLVRDFCSDMPYEVITVITKMDKLKQSERQRQVRLIADSLALAEQPICFSAVTGEGRSVLWQAITQILAAAPKP
ncbi:MAG: YihA family ribosome biogenesis GTP-binding protein [Candidatus Tectomicrobia bacterium]|nr:YihA family ribosome biogenesis GTP-binding protein [Candidatus Tectomicrobia bacterium]